MNFIKSKESLGVDCVSYVFLLVILDLQTYSGEKDVRILNEHACSVLGVAQPTLRKRVKLLVGEGLITMRSNNNIEIINGFQTGTPRYNYYGLTEKTLNLLKPNEK